MSLPIRNHFIDRDLRYLFSYSLELEMERETIGLVPGGVRLNLFGKEGQLFQVLNERSPWAENDLRGKVLAGALDWALLGDDDIGHPDVEITFRTSDGAIILSRYGGMSNLGAGGYRAILRERDQRGEKVPLLGSNEKPHYAKVYITPTYETSHPRYQWLTKLQCVGFGRVAIVDSKPRDITYDIYAMD